MKQEIKKIIKDKKNNKVKIAQTIFDYWQLKPSTAILPYKD